MVEQLSGGRGFGESSTGLLVPDSRIVTEKDLTRIFDINCRKAVEDKLRELDLLLQDQELEFFPKPKVHEYVGPDGMVRRSDALYFVETIIGDHGVLVSFMPEGSESSKHTHEPPITEEYHPIAGASRLRLGEDTFELSLQGGSITVPQFIPHQLTTNSHPALTLIIMWNAALVPPKEWHKLTSGELVPPQRPLAPHASALTI